MGGLCGRSRVKRRVVSPPIAHVARERMGGWVGMRLLSGRTGRSMLLMWIICGCYHWKDALCDVRFRGIFIRWLAAAAG